MPLKQLFDDVELGLLLEVDKENEPSAFPIFSSVKKAMWRVRKRDLDHEPIPQSVTEIDLKGMSQRKVLTTIRLRAQCKVLIVFS